ncbi:MAG TPA: Nif3-like dinuclear metal center hexameric protein [Candidatus Scatomonas pullistercoris]|mgnify:FL=1|uniref:GTP cyclohydrolase 1 type 2 homolog n=1 Tax=Candidatus Scatomonas pullistercoris TaxID=2840920 RepID=A0A9D1P0Q4_9FIRM|nr:Nif3-like dinuclear metal center hexameric protein [Candidatus Scatomonas pullistercoris]
MKSEEIIRLLEEEYPLSCAEEWDNPGLLVGRRDREVRKLLVSLDVTDQAVQEAVSWGADMIISHHPLIFGEIRKINDENFIGRRILTLAERGIVCYAMHTNFDVRGMADLNSQQLGLQNAQVLLVTGERDGCPEGIGRVGELPRPMRLGELSGLVKKAMGLPALRCYGNEKQVVRRAAVSGGSGKSVVADAVRAGAEVLITGDIDYHTAIDAAAQGLLILDAGHYGTESVFIPYMAQKLTNLLPGCQVKGMEIRQPFSVI